MTDADATPHVPRWKTALVWIERLVLAGLVVLAAYRFGPQVGALTGIGPTLGRSPEISFVSLEGESVTAAELRGEVVVLNFWATWCLPCRLEMPSLQRLHEDLGGEGVRVVGLATDIGSERPIREFLGERGITYPVGRATTAQRRAFGGIPGIPTTFIIDRDGVIRHRVVGYFAPPAMRAAVRRLLEPPEMAAWSRAW